MGVTWPQAKDVWGHQELGEARMHPVLSLWREPGSADTWAVDLRPPGCERPRILLFQPPSCAALFQHPQEKGSLA